MIGFELTEEQRELKALARKFSEQEIVPRARDYDEKETFPRDICAKAFDAGLINFGVPKEFRGPGLNILETCVIQEELNYGCSGISNSFSANDLATLPLLIAGNDEQKRIYLGGLIEKLSFSAFALTEPGAGSDAAAMSTTYRRDGDSFVLNGAKHFISNGSMADWIVTFATSDKRLKHSGISCFVFPSKLPGITQNRMHGKLGQRAADTGEIVYDEVRLPLDALVGREGEGFKYAMGTFDRSRPEIGAIATGVSQRALDECLKYSKQRNAFGQPIANFQAIQFMLADSVTELAAARLLTGLGLSAMTVTATTYLSEVMPAAHRGRMQSGVMAIGLLGIPIMSFFARGVIPLGASAWRLVFVLGALGLLALPLIAGLPESPRWLHRHGRIEQAEEVVGGLERRAEVDHGALPRPAADPEAEPASPADYRALLRGRLGRRTLMLAVVWIFQTLGFYGFVSWVPTLLAAHGFDLVHSLTFSALTTLGAAPGALLAWPISDRFGRKHSLVAVAAAVAVCGLAYGLTFNAVAIVAFGFCVNALIQTFAALLYAYTPELYPVALRNSGNGLVYGLGRLSNILGPLIVASIFGSFGYQPVFGYIAACWAVVAVTVLAFGPHTARAGAVRAAADREAAPV
jgi:putative MFS transporter